MRTETTYKGLRLKIAAGLLLALSSVLVVTSILRYVSFRQLLTESLEHPSADAAQVIELQMAAYLRSRLILSACSIAVTLVIGDLLISQIVVGRLRQFLGVVKRTGPGRLDRRVSVEGGDEIAELAGAFNRMAEELRRQADKLSTLNALSMTVSRSLELQEVLRGALDEVLALVGLGAGWIVLRDEQGQEYRLAAGHGLPEGAALAHTPCDWMQRNCAGVFESGQPRVFHDQPQTPCPAADHLRPEGLAFRACVPLTSKDRVLGVMSLVGTASDHTWMFAEDSLETLTAIGRQIGMAIENARLYEELRQTERLRRQLMERGIDVQEEERRRIARELHDQTSQRLTSMIMTLGALSEDDSVDGLRERLQDLRSMAAETLEEVHGLALELRPRLLDDLGLLAALRHYVGEFRDRYRIPTDFQVLGMGDRRLPPQVETALYRIAQEALNNVARHAGARSAGVLLEHRTDSAILIVEDDGEGFDVPAVMGSHVDERNLGLYGMRERAALLGGTMTIESTLGTGTSVFTEVPLAREE
jgi:signal transduction histidine kinase